MQQDVNAYTDAQNQVAKQAQLQAQIQAIQQKNQLDALLAPGEVTHQGLVNTNLQQNNAFDAQANPIRLQDLGNNAIIGGVNAQYAGAKASNDLLGQRQALTMGAAALTPSSTYDSSGNLIRQGQSMPLAGVGIGTYSGIGTVFAGPSDTADYAKNHSLATGDNGIGAWGADTTDVNTPLVAIKPSILAANGIDPNHAAGTPVTVNVNGTTVQAKVGDKIGENAPSGASIDLNPGVAKAAGIDPNNFKGQVSFSLGNTASPSGVLAQSLSPNPTVQSIPGSGDLSNPTPIGIPPVTTGFGDPVHPAVSGAIDLAQQTAAFSPAASQALAIKALDLHNTLSAPQSSGAPVSTIASTIPVTSGAIPLFQPSAPVPAYKDPTTGQMIPGNPTPGLPVRSQMIPAPQENPKAAEILKDASDKSVDPPPFKIPPSPGNPYGSLDVTGLQKALAAKTQSLPLSRLQQEFQTNKDVQAFHAAAGQANSIADNLNNFPFATRNSANDNAIEKTAAGNELPGQAVSQPSINSIKASQTYGEELDNALSNIDPIRGLHNIGANYLPPWISGAGLNIPAQPRSISDRALMANADTVQSNVKSRLPAYQAVLNQYRNQAKAEGLDPDVVFPPEEQQPIIGAATRQMYPGQKPVAPAATTQPAAHPDNDPAGTIRAQGGKQYQKQADGTWQSL